MKKKVFKKVLAGMLAATMALGMSMSVLAEGGDTATSGGTTGEGGFEGHVDREVLKVQLPTVAADDATFSYTMDPEGLIAATQGAKDKEASFEEGANVYFLSAPNTYTKNSAKMKVVNKGAVDADVTITAETVANTNVAMSDGTDLTDGKFADSDTAAKLYLGLQVANQPTAAVQAAGGTSGASVTVGLKGKSDNFEVKYDEAGKAYSFEAKAGVPETAWNSFEFGLTGVCNPKGDYSTADLDASDVTVTWSYEKREKDSTDPVLSENAVADAAPSVETKTYIMTSGQDVLVDISLGGGNLAATGVSSVSYVVSGRGYSFASGEFSVEDNKLILNHSKTDVFVNSGVKDREITIQFNDTAKTTGKVILTTAD